MNSSFLRFNCLLSVVSSNVSKPINPLRSNRDLVFSTAKRVSGDLDFNWSHTISRSYTSHRQQRNNMETVNPISQTFDKVVTPGEIKRKCEEDGSSVDDKKVKTESGPRDMTRIRPKKFAILLSYCGVDYYGLQRNAQVKTIEGDLFDALLKLDLIKQEQFERPQEFNFQRAARTDKGVSAIKQILSCKMPDFFPDKISEINALLPPQIRVIAVKKTTKNFDCKNYCDGRTYAYMMPSYTLAEPEEKIDLTYRVTSDRIDRFNQLLSKYLGTHNFFNFTSQKASVDPSAMRYIIKMECGQPFIRKGLEFLVVRVKGQSFMLHQIRKMMGLAIGVMRGYAPEDVIEKAFELERLDIPIAPGLGLMLEEVHYDKYNKRFSGDGIHESLTWDEYNEEIQSFLEEYIHPVIIDTEINELSMLKWLQILPIHTFTVREPGPPGPPIDEQIEAPSGERSFMPYKMAVFNAGLLIDNRSVTQESKDDHHAEPTVDRKNEANQSVQENRT